MIKNAEIRKAHHQRIHSDYGELKFKRESHLIKSLSYRAQEKKIDQISESMISYHLKNEKVE